MGELKSKVKLTLSRLKNYTFSLDWQDIYQCESKCKPSLNNPISIDFKVFDNEEAFKHIHDILPMSSYDRQIALKRIEAGDKAIIGFHEDLPVFYGWLMFDEMEMTYGVYVPMAGATFAYNLFTKASFRRQGALSQFYQFTRDYLKRQKRHGLYCGIDTRNTPSIKGHLKNGFRKTGFFYTLKVLGVVLTLADSKYPKRLTIHKTKYFL